MTIAVGDMLPAGTLFRVTETGPTEVPTAALFAGRTLAVVAVPGAFTPVCSEKHLPGFIAHADEIKAAGIDEIVCLSVNDVYVMRAWEEHSGASGKVAMYGDDGSFVKALGLALEIPRFGLGVRAKRFTMLVRNGRVEQLNVEDSPSNVGVSSAEHMCSLKSQWKNPLA